MNGPSSSGGQDRVIAILMLILFSASILASLGVLSYWCAVLWHVVRTWWLIPTARAGLAAPPPAEVPTVCVVVPAHNEAACIGTIASSLLAQDYPADRMSMVFALDRCTDGTDAALRAALGDQDDTRALIVPIAACPQGWAGKVNALWTAVRTAPRAQSADILLFADADTIFDPACVRACVGLLQARGLGMLSLLSTLTQDRWFERIAQPAAGMELVRMYPIVRANWPRQGRPFANGQFIMVRRDAYEAFGGHEAVHWAVLEDVELARAADRAGVRIGVFLADGLLHCRMYASWGEFRRGWKRIFSESANRKRSRLLGIAWRLRTLGVILPALAGTGAAGGLVLRVRGEPGPLADWALGLGAAALAIYAAALLSCMALGRSRLSGAAWFPVGAWLVAGVMREAAADLRKGRPMEWAGMTYSREAR